MGRERGGTNKKEPEMPEYPTGKTNAGDGDDGGR